MDSHQTEMGLPHSERSEIPIDEHCSGEMGVNSNRREPTSRVPSWYIENCVKTTEELRRSQIPLDIRRTPLHEDPRHRSRTQPFNADRFEIESVLYEELFDVLARPTKPSVACNQNFGYNAMYLRFPTAQEDIGCVAFLRAVIEHFAKDIGADLIDLGLQNVIDLAQHCAGVDYDPDSTSAFEKYMELYFGEPTSHDSDPIVENGELNNDVLDESLGEVTKPASHNFEPVSAESGDTRDNRRTGRPHFPFAEIFHAPRTKRTAKDRTTYDKHAPLVVYFPEIELSMGSMSYRSNHPLKSIYGQWVLTAIRLAVGAETRHHRNVLLVATSHHAPTYYDAEYLVAAGTNPMKKAICLVPVTSRDHQKFLKDNAHQEKYHSHMNVSALKRKLREMSPENRTASALQSYASWSAIQDVEISKALSKYQLFPESIDSIVDRLKGDLDDNNVADAIKAVVAEGEKQDRRHKIIEEWKDRDDEDDGEGKWQAFAPAVQAAIRKIEEGGDKFECEQSMLDCIVNPDKVESRWVDIEIDPEVQQAITQIVSHSTDTKRRNYGILKNGRIGGALLYGLPGTGKTHLARVLARESDAVTITVSAADIASKWYGETEKAIKGLFNLARQITPSIIFIDEADSLFRQRRPEDHSWERDRTNQFLAEMDGLVKEKNAPFVLLASNFPHQLDYAVLRRVPSRFYIRLPPVGSRKRIFEIFLKEEILEDGVNLKDISARTRGYTGSDIQTMCVQAALACEASSSGFNEEGKRVLTHSHFEKALQMSSRTVSVAALENIRSFAKEFDQRGWTKVQADEGELEGDEPVSAVEDATLKDTDYQKRYEQLRSKLPSQKQRKWQTIPRGEKAEVQEMKDEPLPSYKP